MRPKVSVIVPVYNTEKYLRNCLDSLMFQTLQEIEVIAVNDGSTDGCKDILEEYKEKYPDKMVVIHKENGGQATARNLALGIFTGEYLGFLDSDDFVQKDMFEKMYNTAKSQDADYVACGYTDITYEDEKEVVLQNYVASKVAKKTKDMFFGALASPFLHLYKREVMEQSKVRFTEGYIYEDTAFYLNLIPYIKKLATIEEALAVRLRHSNSTMTTFKKEKVRNIFPVLEDSISFYERNGFSEEYKKELEYFCVRILLCSSLQRISKVAGFKNACELVDETMSFIGKHFPEYRSNPYMKKGKLSLYMKCMNRVTARCALVLFRITNKFKREYT